MENDHISVFALMKPINIADFANRKKTAISIQCVNLV